MTTKNTNVDTAEQLDQEALQAKLRDTQIPGYLVPFDPEEAEQLGAFVEDAMTEAEAADSSTDISSDIMDG